MLIIGLIITRPLSVDVNIMPFFHVYDGIAQAELKQNARFGKVVASTRLTNY